MVERPEDLNLPFAVVSRIIKDTLPDGVAVTKEARSAIAKAASVFVLFTTSTALTISQKNKKKTLAAHDVISAMEEMQFDKFIDPLQAALDKYKQDQISKKEAKSKAKEKDAVEKTGEDKAMEVDNPPDENCIAVENNAEDNVVILDDDDDDDDDNEISIID